MPELPEVESTRRHIAPVLEGAVIRQASVRRDRTARHNLHPGDVEHRLTGRRVGQVGRRGKFLLIEVEEDLTWVIHLGMSGRLTISSADEPEVAHTNFMVDVGAGQIRFIDPRTFGFVAVFTADELARSSIPGLGPDALDQLPSSRGLGERLAGRTAPIKALLLDQRILAGLGNIYADEVLFRARVAPRRPAGSLSPTEVAAIRRAIRPVLEDGIRHGGTSLDDLAYLLPDGRAGEFTSRLAVYGRAGERCRRCGGVIQRMVIAQRSSHFCPGCQT